LILLECDIPQCKKIRTTGHRALIGLSRVNRNRSPIKNARGYGRFLGR
jgi:hypothetical protein